jgi:hypothetical protein
MEGRWAHTMGFWNGPQLLIIDELGYLPMPGEAASHLFQVISSRYEHGSIVLTTRSSAPPCHLEHLHFGSTAMAPQNTFVRTTPSGQRAPSMQLGTVSPANYGFRPTRPV